MVKSINLFRRVAPEPNSMHTWLVLQKPAQPPGPLTASFRPFPDIHPFNWITTRRSLNGCADERAMDGAQVSILCTAAGLLICSVTDRGEPEIALALLSRVVMHHLITATPPSKQ